MKRVAIVALLLTVVVAAACVSRNKSGSQTVSESNTANPQQASPASTVAPTPSPTAKPQIGYVTDSANIMDQSSRHQLETTLAAFRQREKIDFAVVTVGSTGSQSVRDYSLALARDRKSNIRDEHANRGILLLVAVNDHHWHIQVTRNLESTLTNEVLVTLSKPMRDSFIQKRYGEGIIKYVDAIISKLAELNVSGKGNAATLAV